MKHTVVSCGVGLRGHSDLEATRLCRRHEPVGRRDDSQPDRRPVAGALLKIQRHLGVKEIRIAVVRHRRGAVELAGEKVRVAQ